MELHSILRCIVMMTRYGDNLETGCPFLDQSMQEKQPVSGSVYTKVYKKICQWQVLQIKFLLQQEQAQGPLYLRCIQCPEAVQNKSPDILLKEPE